MELIYNELSETPPSANKFLANEKVGWLIECYKKAIESGFDRIRFSKQFHEIELANGYSLRHWLDESDQRNYKDIILGASTFPFIKPEDTWAEDEYLKHHFYFENAPHSIVKTECLGLAAAHLYDTLSVSFSGSQVWERNAIEIIKVNDESQLNEKLDIINIYSVGCFTLKIIRDFVERISEVVLVHAILQPADKLIHFRPDHGTNILHDFARKLVKSPYVIGIVNSLAWNSHNTNFIRRVYPNGLIEVVLYWTDEGLGMVIETTGRNFRETDEIARILEEEFT